MIPKQNVVGSSPITRSENPSSFPDYTEVRAPSYAGSSAPESSVHLIIGSYSPPSFSSCQRQSSLSSGCDVRWSATMSSHGRRMVGRLRGKTHPTPRLQRTPCRQESIPLLG